MSRAFLRAVCACAFACVRAFVRAREIVCLGSCASTSFKGRMRACVSVCGACVSGVGGSGMAGLSSAREFTRVRNYYSLFFFFFSFRARWPPVGFLIYLLNSIFHACMHVSRFNQENGEGRREDGVRVRFFFFFF